MTGSGSVTSATQDVSGIDVSSLPDGTLTFSVTLTDAAGQRGLRCHGHGQLDTAVPSGYTITADQTVIDAAEATRRRASPSPGPRPARPTVTRSPAAAAARLGHRQRQRDLGHARRQRHQRLRAARRHPDLQRHLDRRRRQRRCGGHGHGHARPRRRPAATRSRPTRPRSPPARRPSTGFTFAGATTGTTYNYTITSSGAAAASVTGSGSVTSATQDVSGIDVSRCPDGTLTYSVTLTDALGNTGKYAVGAPRWGRPRSKRWSAPG